VQDLGATEAHAITAAAGVVLPQVARTRGLAIRREQVHSAEHAIGGTRQRCPQTRVSKPLSDD
jgi:hypothetical protein